MDFKKILTTLFLVALALSSLNAIAKSSKKSLCDEPGYVCLKVRGGQTWASLFPDERERGIVMRINHRNGGLWAGLKLKVPENLETGDLLDYSPFPKNIEAPNEKVIVFDPKLNAWAAYDADGQQVRWGPATGGKKWCDDIDQSCLTKAGEFRVYSLGSSNCVSTKFPIPDGGAPMPYCMFFNGGQALHGSPGGVVRGNVSHGCVRLFVEDAEWLRYDFVEGPEPYNNFRGTKVVVMPYTDPKPEQEADAGTTTEAQAEPTQVPVPKPKPRRQSNNIAHATSDYPPDDGMGNYTPDLFQGSEDNSY